MKKLLAGISGIAVATLLGLASAQAQDTIKIGLIMSFSGQFADLGTMMDAGVKLYMKEHGDTIAGKKIEIIRKDSGAAGTAPDVAKRLAQELIVRDKVDIIAGFSLTPDALAAADVFTESKKVAVIMNAATAIITAKSPYFARTSIPLPAAMGALGTWAAKTGGAKQTFTMVTNYGPGIDSEVAFQTAFKAAGGNVVGGVRFPVANPDFSAFAQQLKDSKADSVYIFVPGGEQPAALGKALAEHGVTPKTVKIFSSGELVNDEPLKSMGDAALGIISGWSYSWTHKSDTNAKFVKGINEMLNGRNPDQFTVSGYDGMQLIYKALEKTKGNADGDTLIAAMKGLAWESPRGPVSIDPETRDIVQNIYLRRVETVNGKPQVVEFDKLDAVKDPVKAALKADGKLNPDGTAK